MIQIFWDVSPCHWVSSSWYFRGSQCLHLQRWSSPKFGLELLIPWKKNTQCSLKRLWPTQPRTLYHIPEDLNPQQLQCENPNFTGQTKCSLTFIRSSRRNSLWTFSLRGLSSCGFKVNNSWMAALNVTRLKLEYIKKMWNPVLCIWY